MNEQKIHDAVSELKVRAELLHKAIASGDPVALSRLRALADYRKLPEAELAKNADTIQRRICLAVIAAELGFPDWYTAKAALSGEHEVADFGTLLYPVPGGGHTNLWYAKYEEAAAVLAARGGYLLGYKRQFLVVDHHFIESLRLDPADPDWAAIGFDWIRPFSVAARSRLYDKRVAQLPRDYGVSQAKARATLLAKL